MPAAYVNVRERDLSTFAPAFGGVYQSIVIRAMKGPIDEPVLITTQKQLLKYFTPDETINTSYDNAYHSALKVLDTTNKLWVVRAANNDAEYASLRVKLNSSTSETGYILFGALPLIEFTGDTIIGSTTINNISITTVGVVIEDLLGRTIVMAGDTMVVTGATGTTLTVEVAPTSTGTAVPGTSAAVEGTVDGTIDPTAVAFEADDALLLYSANQGAWGNDVRVKIVTDPLVVKEADAFIIEVYKSSNVVVPVESFVVSRLEDKIDGYGNNIFIDEVLIRSNYIRSISNPADAGVELPKAIGDVSPIALMGGDNGGAITHVELIRAVNTIANPLSYPLTLLLDGGQHITEYQKRLIEIAETRKDCMAILSVPQSVEADRLNYVTNLSEWMKTTMAINSSYAAVYTPHVKVTDQFNGKAIWLAPDFAAGNAISYSSENFELWSAPAGFKRGRVSADDTSIRFELGELDAITDLNVNPIRFYKGKGIVIWNQSTALSRPSALQNVNVRLLLVYIEPAIKEALEDFLFEVNDSATRRAISFIIKSYMDKIKARGGVYDYKLVCDSSNNSDEDTDNYRLNVDLFVKPTKDIKYIEFTTIITRTGMDFVLSEQLA